MISIIIPVYLVEKFLERCVDSLLRQTYRNIEVILVDDGSPDRCGKICDQYARRDPRIRVIHKGNGGLSDARNAGIESAKGEFISFVDGDDWVHDEYLERLYRLLRSRDADIAICDFKRTSTENIDTDQLNEEVIYEYNNKEALKQYLGDFKVQMVIACGKLYKKELFADVRFPVGRVHEDEFTTHKLLYKAKKIIFTTNQLLYYWQREGSIMGGRLSLKNQLDALDALLERSVFFREIGLKELSDRSNKYAFYTFRTIFRYLRQNNMKDIENKYYRKFLDLKVKLRDGRYKFKFRVFYEAYYISPVVFDRIHDLYLVLKRCPHK